VSSQAVASARHNVEGQFAGGKARFCHSDGIPGDAGQFELILLNPPFHEGGVVGDHIALRLFAEASRHLAPGGRMLMVGNRHLGYHRSLRRFFGQVRQLAAAPKFVVFEAATQPAGRSYPRRARVPAMVWVWLAISLLARSPTRTAEKMVARRVSGIRCTLKRLPVTSPMVRLAPLMAMYPFGK